VFPLAVELNQFALKVSTHVGHDLFHPGEVAFGEDLVPELSYENQVNVHRKYAMSTSSDRLR